MAEGTRANASNIESDPGNIEPAVEIFPDERTSITTRLSKRRWAILFAISLFGLGGAVTEESNTILHTMLDLLELPVHKYLYITQSFFYAPILLTMPTAWFVDRYGIRLPMYGVIVFMFVKNFSRALLFNPDISNWHKFKMAYWIVSNVASMQVSSLFYCTPLKISENWFAESERSFAWVLMLYASNIGNLAVALTLPRIIHSIRDVKPLFYLNIATPIITSIAILTCITKSKPKYPPSERMVKSLAKIPFFVSIKAIFKSRDILLHLLHEAFVEGVSVAILTVIQDILTSSGHTEVFVGNLVALNALISLVMTIALSFFVHRIQNITLICKAASLTKALTFVTYLFSMLYPFQDWVVIVATVMYHLCRCWASPNAYNMTAHIASGQVSQAIIAGFGITLTLITIIMNQLLIASLVGNVRGKSDYTHAIVFASIATLVSSTVYLLFFNGGSKKSENIEVDGDESLDSNSTTELNLD